MNWLIYIGGYFLTGHICESIVFGPSGTMKLKWVIQEEMPQRIFFMAFHLMTWVWICWRFIR